MSKPIPVEPIKKPAEAKPAISESVVDVPSQRLYYLSLGVLCQAIKLFDFVRYWFIDGRTARYTIKWIVVDTLYCVVLPFLRIPRLNYAASVVVLQVFSLWLLNGFMFGGITVNLGLGGEWGMPSVRLNGPSDIPETRSSTIFADVLSGVGLGALFGADSRDSHLLGQHTVRMSPISTANLNPEGHTFCIARPGQYILVPVVLNNTNPTHIKYSLTPLGLTEGGQLQDNAKAIGKVERFELSAKDLKAIEHARLEALQVARHAASAKRHPEDYEDYEDDDEDDVVESPGVGYNLQKTQSLVHIRLSKPGVLRLERVLDSSSVDARLVYPAEVVIAPCPRAAFAPTSSLTIGQNVRCAAPGLTSGSGEDLALSIDVFGVPPLSLRWHRAVNGHMEPFMVEGIEGDEHMHKGVGDSRRYTGASHRAAQQLNIPLTVTLDSLGSHAYVLESVSDALGNVVGSVPTLPDGPSLGSANETMRSVQVLRRPAVSFRHCSPANPTSLRIGSEAQLAIAAKQADALDLPLDVEVNFNPSEKDDNKKSKSKPWISTYKTKGESKDLTVLASRPGEYTITHVKGRYCEGDVLSPDVCKVVERPIPTAEIEWKKIHECSGDIGVSASLVLHGTPPFIVSYSQQRDSEPPQVVDIPIAKARHTFTIQPDQSGHYTFTFLKLSDANYKRVDLKGPSIDQIVHPMASADFAYNLRPNAPRKRLSNCAGSHVDVDVELKGTGPWNVEVQVVGPKGSEIISVPKITSNWKKLQIPIPDIVDRDGGSFDIDLVSVEDAYGCKRPVSVTGVTVDVRRVKPTGKFYGAAGKRKVTILEGERATLPLRLTGDGPWSLKYKRLEAPSHILTARVASPNDELRVTEKGHYELVEIVDAQCPGTIVPDSADYFVDWVPRPSAKLSPEIQTTYERYNNSHILPPICAGLNDHVDLDLIGRPPFQIMYNIAKNTEGGNTKIIDQPTFSSIQPRTRFQLHTSEPARIYYEVKQIGDAAYPLSKNKNGIIPRSERLLFEQQVLQRPTAQFASKKRLTYCAGDTLVPQDVHTSDGLVLLSGTPPFELQLTVRDLATSEAFHQTFEIVDTYWKLDVPAFAFKSIGPHEVIIDSVKDASHCQQAATDPSAKTLWVDVAETAAIVPFDRKDYFCAGEVSQFQLEGTPPWTIGYSVNGKAFTQESRVSPWSLVQAQEGEFAITSVAHQQKMCKTAVPDLRYTVHPLPAAQVGHGKRIIQDIHEGDQAEILFTLIGEPPFTFTYQRTELSPKKGTQGKVLETHTVSGVTTKEYSIFSALEGTWTVTFIQDRYCRYPPIQSDGALEKSRR